MEEEGQAVRVRHSYGEDLVVFGDLDGVETASGAVINAPIACVQQRDKGETLTLGPAGKATIRGQVFEASQPLVGRIGSSP
jgi:hypothetical protein